MFKDLVKSGIHLEDDKLFVHELCKYTLQSIELMCDIKATSDYGVEGSTGDRHARRLRSLVLRKLLEGTSR